MGTVSGAGRLSTSRALLGVLLPGNMQQGQMPHLCLTDTPAGNWITAAGHIITAIIGGW